MRTTVVGLVMAAACAPAPSQSGSTATVSSNAPPPVSTTTLITTTAAVDGSAPCLEGTRPFTEEGSAGIGGEEGSDAAVISSLHWESYPGCEQVVLELATDNGAPAVDPPTLDGRMLRNAGVLRVSLGPAINGSALTDHLIDTDLITRVYVVRRLDGTIYIDLHLNAPAFVRVTARSEPARVVIDLQPGGSEYLAVPVTVPGLVVVEPTAGSIRYPLNVNGYRLGGVGEIGGRLTGAEDGSVAAAPTAVEERIWREFDLLFPSGPTGRIKLIVDSGPELSLTTAD